VCSLHDRRVVAKPGAYGPARASVPGRPIRSIAKGEECRQASRTNDGWAADRGSVVGEKGPGALPDMGAGLSFPDECQGVRPRVSISGRESVGAASPCDP